MKLVTGRHPIRCNEIVKKLEFSPTVASFCDTKEGGVIVHQPFLQDCASEIPGLCKLSIQVGNKAISKATKIASRLGLKMI